MAVSLGKNFRRLLAQALAADEDKMCALVERLLPRGKDGKRVLRPANDDDCQLLPLAIVAALSADAITGAEAEELKRQAKDAKPIKAPRPWWQDPPPEFLRMTPEERLQAGYVRPLEEDPLREAILAWGKAANCCGAAENGAAIVNNNENTMTENEAGSTRQKPLCNH